jgi:DNA repair protein RAD57
MDDGSVEEKTEPGWSDQIKFSTHVKQPCRRLEVLASLQTLYVLHNPNASMTDLASVLPGFPTQQYVRLLPSLEKNHITTADLLTLDFVEIAKRAQLPLLDLKRLCNAVLEALQNTLGVRATSNDALDHAPLRKPGKEFVDSWSTISTLDVHLDFALGGGIPSGYVTEVTGEA